MHVCASEEQTYISTLKLPYSKHTHTQLLITLHTWQINEAEKERKRVGDSGRKGRERKERERKLLRKRERKREISGVFLNF